MQFFNRGLCKLLINRSPADPLMCGLGHSVGRPTLRHSTPKKRVRFVWLAVTLTTTMTAYVVLGSGVAPAQTLEEALATAYENNPTLNAQRARLRATNEQVPQALSGYRPTLRAFSEVGRTYLDSNTESLVGAEKETLFSRTYGATIEQPLFRGGQTAAATRGAENTVRAERARLDSIEQTVLLDGSTAYSDVYRDQAVLELTIRNEQRLATQLEATRDRFQVGEVTRTDVSQAEARLARATSERIGAEGDLAASRAVFRNVIGMAPAVLPRPPLPRGLPASLAEADSIAIGNNPDVTTAEFRERSALDSVDQVSGELWPTLSLIGRLQRQEDVSRRNSRFDSAEAVVNLNVPLYQAGAVYSRLRERKQLVVEQRRLLDQSQRNAVEDATRAWNALETAGAEIGSFAKQVEANQIALEGVEKEAEVGARTVLDILDAQQELLNSQVSLVRAERDEVVAAFQLKASLGLLTARQLDLPVDYYDPELHYRQVRDSWWGGSSIGDISSDFDARPGTK
jgi:outer membrane protein